MPATAICPNGPTAVEIAHGLLPPADQLSVGVVPCKLEINKRVLAIHHWSGPECLIASDQRSLLFCPARTDGLIPRELKDATARRFNLEAVDFAKIFWLFRPFNSPLHRRSEESSWQTPRLR